MFNWLQNINTKDYLRYRYATMIYNKRSSLSKLSILKKGLDESGRLLRGQYTIYYKGNNRDIIKRELDLIFKTI